jgi:hypothetical protein
MDYAKTARSVQKTLARYGQSVTLRRYSVGGGDYRPGNQVANLAGGAPVDSIRKALVTEQPGTRIGPQYGVNLKEGTLIQNAEKWLYMDAIGIEPRPNDKVIINGVEFMVVDVQGTAPGGTVLFYLIVLRR